MLHFNFICKYPILAYVFQDKTRQTGHIYRRYIRTDYASFDKSVNYLINYFFKHNFFGDVDKQDAETICMRLFDSHITLQEFVNRYIYLILKYYNTREKRLIDDLGILGRVVLKITNNIAL